MNNPVVLLKFLSCFILGDSVIQDGSFTTMERCEIVRAEYEKMNPPWGMTVRYKCVER